MEKSNKSSKSYFQIEVWPYPMHGMTVQMPPSKAVLDLFPPLLSQQCLLGSFCRNIGNVFVAFSKCNLTAWNFLKLAYALLGILQVTTSILYNIHVHHIWGREWYLMKEIRLNETTFLFRIFPKMSCLNQYKLFSNESQVKVCGFTNINYHFCLHQMREYLLWIVFSEPWGRTEWEVESKEWLLGCRVGALEQGKSMQEGVQDISVFEKVWIFWADWEGKESFYVNDGMFVKDNLEKVEKVNRPPRHFKCHQLSQWCHPMHSL